MSKKSKPAQNAFSTLSSYLKDISSIPTLTKEQEQELGRAVQAKGEDFEEARAKFIESNLKLVITVANRMAKRYGVGLSDLVQEGNLGVIKAVQKFDPDKGFRFSTYAVWWIRQAMQRYLHENGLIRIPLSQTEYKIKVAKAMAAIKDPALKYDPEEIAKVANIPLKKVFDLECLPTKFTPFDTPIHDSNSSNMLTLADVLKADETRFPQPDHKVIRENELQRLSEVLETKLSERDRVILDLRFGLNGFEPHTLTEIGSIVGLSRERIRQLIRKQLRRLRGYLET
jgi:RNA polymerase sigma factor (sigma-70 family)